MSTTTEEQTPLEEVRIADRTHFKEGPPLELFRRLRAECPVHWSTGISECIELAGIVRVGANGWRH
ncbi:MAG: hypothetical protein WBP81_12665 [Solirubrobacteraceae bacterium]